MPLFATAKRHFDEDLARAKALAGHANGLKPTSAGEELLRDDLLRSAWMFAVGAADAYFCDAYVDAVTVTLRAKVLDPSLTLPAFILNIQSDLPLGKISGSYPRRPNWKLRMATRQFMEKSSVLSLKEIRELFNNFFPAKKNKKLFYEVIDMWITYSSAPVRVFGVSLSDYNTTTGKLRDTARKKANMAIGNRYRMIFQRRHDAIHNCDRPRTKPQAIDSGNVKTMLIDISFLVERFHHHLRLEFADFLIGIGCTQSLRTTLMS